MPTIFYSSHFDNPHPSSKVAIYFKLSLDKQLLLQGSLEISGRAMKINIARKFTKSSSIMEFTMQTDSLEKKSYQIDLLKK